MRTLLIVLAALALGACNTVYSRTPLLSEAAHQGDPQLRPGLWQFGVYQDDKCPFDIRLPVARWPDCATGLEYQPGQIWLVSKRQRLLAQTVRLAPGDPVLAQRHFSTDVLKDPRAPEPRDADNPFFGWTYAALTVVKTDGADRIVEARMIEPICGPLPPPAPGGAAPTVTDRPFPGLKIVKTNCVAQDLDTVKAALALSEPLVQAQTIRWIRDRP